MSADYDDSDWLGPWPFWFVSSPCLAEVLRAEIKAIIQLFAKYPDLRKLFDAPQITIPERTMCFQLLAHRKIIGMIDQTLVDRYEPPMAFNEEESSALGTSANLVAPDAPAWARGMADVTERLPVHIHRALPELLRERGFYTGDSPKDETVRSAAKTLDTVEQIQALTSGVFDEQLKRLKERWAAADKSAGVGVLASGQPGEPKKPKHWLKGTKGLGPKKADCSQYMANLTEKQQLAFSLRLEYRRRLAEVASRMGRDRKTACEHIATASRKINEAVSADRRRANRSKTNPE